MKVKKKSDKDEQAVDDDTDAGKKIATLLGKKIPYSWDIHFNKAKFFQVRIFFHENNNMYLIFISILGG